MNSHGYSWNPANWGPGSGMPSGILSVTVPGSVWGWDEVLRRFGSMTFKETLQPAIDYAEQGFPLSERIASDWRLPRGLPPVPGDPAKCCTQLDPDSIANWYIGGKPPEAGQIFRNPDLAKTFRILQQKGRDGFYKGEIAQRHRGEVEGARRNDDPGRPGASTRASGSRRRRRTITATTWPPFRPRPRPGRPTRC